MRLADRKIEYVMVFDKEKCRWVAAEHEKDTEKGEFSAEFEKKLP